MMIENFEDCLKLAKEFLAKKERKNYYEFKVIQEPFAEYVCTQNELTDEQVERLRELKAKYHEAFVKHLSEAIDEDTIDCLDCGDELVDIELDYVQHQYRFKVHHVKPDGTVATYDRLVTLSDDEYARLLAWHMLDNHLIINTLRYRDSNLYSHILREIDLYYWEDGMAITQDAPYLVTMDEAKADAELIVKENGIKQPSGYLFISL